MQPVNDSRVTSLTAAVDQALSHYVRKMDASLFGSRQVSSHDHDRPVQVSALRRDLSDRQGRGRAGDG
jgi:hypothetical protein